MKTFSSPDHPGMFIHYSGDFDRADLSVTVDCPSAPAGYLESRTGIQALRMLAMEGEHFVVPDPGRPGRVVPNRFLREFFGDLARSKMIQDLQQMELVDVFARTVGGPDGFAPADESSLTRVRELIQQMAHGPFVTGTVRAGGPVRDGSDRLLAMMSDAPDVEQLLRDADRIEAIIDKLGDQLDSGEMLESEFDERRTDLWREATETLFALIAALRGEER